MLHILTEMEKSTGSLGPLHSIVRRVKLEYFALSNFQSLGFVIGLVSHGRQRRPHCFAVGKFVMTLSLHFLWLTFRAAHLAELRMYKLQKLFYQFGETILKRGLTNKG